MLLSSSAAYFTCHDLVWFNLKPLLFYLSLSCCQLLTKVDIWGWQVVLLAVSNYSTMFNGDICRLPSWGCIRRIWSGTRWKWVGPVTLHVFGWSTRFLGTQFLSPIGAHQNLRGGKGSNTLLREEGFRRKWWNSFEVKTRSGLLDLTTLILPHSSPLENHQTEQPSEGAAGLLKLSSPQGDISVSYYGGY